MLVLLLSAEVAVTVPCAAGMSKLPTMRTLGGVVVDADARVRGADGQAIPGLYATGGVSDALAAASWLAPLTALGLGRLAALHVIAAVSAEAEA